MGILIRLNLTGDQDELNIAIQNDDDDGSNAKPMAYFNLPFNKTRNRITIDNHNISTRNNIPTVKNHHNSSTASMNTNLQGSDAAVIDLTDEPLYQNRRTSAQPQTLNENRSNPTQVPVLNQNPRRSSQLAVVNENQNSATQPRETMGYYIVEKILGSRMNSETKRPEFLLTLKSCSSTNNWNPVSNPEDIDLAQPDSVLYVDHVQQSNEALIPQQQQDPILSDDVNVWNEQWNSLDVEEMKYQNPEQNSTEEAQIESVDLPETESKMFEDEAEEEPHLHDESASHDTEEKTSNEIPPLQNGSEYRCPHCGVSVAGDLSWKKHSKRCQKIKFCCPDCPRSFSNSYLLKKHAGVHRNDEFRCSMCGSTYSSITFLRAHEKEVHRLGFQRNPMSRPIKVGRKRGPKTKVAIAEEAAGVGHTRGVVRKRTTIFVCSTCDELFDSAVALKKHKMSSHKMICSACHKVFKHMWQLQIHEKVHLKDVTEAESSSSAVTTSASDQAAFTDCVPCNLQFDLKAALLFHQQVDHNSDRSLATISKCFICGLTVKYRANLRRHMLCHTGEKPFKCELCNFASTNNRSLQQHHLKHHLKHHVSEA